MYYDQSKKPLRDSIRLYYAAITTNHRIGCYRNLRKAKAREGGSTTDYRSGAGYRMPPPAKEDPAWVIGSSPAELRADSRKDGLKWNSFAVQRRCD